MAKGRTFLPILGPIQRQVAGWQIRRQAETDISILERRAPGTFPGEDVEGVTNFLDPEDLESPSPIHFRDVTESSGIKFRHFPATRASLLPEDMGSGVAGGARS